MDVVMYQMLYQIWRNKPGEQVARTIVMTSALLFLCEEDLTSENVRLTALDSSTFKDISKVYAESSDPLCITLVFKPSSVMGITYRKWRLKAPDSLSAAKLLSELVKAKGEGARDRERYR